MAQSWTYSTLKDALQDWTENEFSDFTGELDTIIANAELRCLADLDLEIFDETNTDRTTTASTSTVATPNDTMTVLEVWVNDVYCQQRSHAFVRWYGKQATEGTPAYWAHNEEEQIELAPAPSSTGWTVEMRVMTRPAGLSDANTETWLSQNAANLLWAACRAEAEAFQMAPEDEKVWLQKYAVALQQTAAEMGHLKRRRYRRTA